MSSLSYVCRNSRVRYTTRDGLIGAGVMLLATFVSVALGVAARHRGWAATGEMLTSLAFPVSLTLSMPFWVLKGQPWKAQAVLVGGTMGLLFVIAYVSTLI